MLKRFGDMFPYEDRMKAVKLLIRYDMCYSDVIRELGYPSNKTLRNRYQEYKQSGDLHSKSNKADAFTSEEKHNAVDYYLEHGKSVSRTVRKLGYPSRPTLDKWIAEDLKVVVSQFLESRGLMLSEGKTIITHIDEGFDFLGWTFRKFKGKLIVKPSKSSIKSLIRKLSTIILKEGKASTQSNLIRRLNQVIRGWTNYHKHVVSSQAFSYVNNTLYYLLLQWAKHRHPNKSKWWRLNKYWHDKNGKRWLFTTDDYTLINLRRINIVRHPKLQISKNPFLDKKYFHTRKMKLHVLVAA